MDQEENDNNEKSDLCTIYLIGGDLIEVSFDIAENVRNQIRLGENLISFSINSEDGRTELFHLRPESILYIKIVF